tara:strand:- start:285 stop:467 length:183 start_codon:yes stop_codon:yes gene_type:complete
MPDQRQNQSAPEIEGRHDMAYGYGGGGRKKSGSMMKMARMKKQGATAMAMKKAGKKPKRG